MSRSADLLVIGGGIAGLTTALAAAQRGLAVTVLDATRPGAASRAAAGMLAPSVEGLPAAVHAVAMQARDLYPEFLAGLRARTGVHVPLDRNGIIQLAGSSAELRRVAAAAHGAAQVFDAESLALLEPAFAGHLGGVLHPHDGSVDNVTLMRALVLAADGEQGVHRVPGAAARIEFAGGTASVVTTDGARLVAPVVLLATGAWASELPGLPRPLPVQPIRGQLLLLDRCPVAHVTYGGGGYLVPRGDALIIGATSEATGFANATTDEGLATLLAIATRAVKGLSSATVLEHWAGLRPVTPDALPILGADPELPQLLYACGFSRNGILLAPWAASRLAALAAGEPADESLRFFTCDRFDKRNLTD